MIKVSKLLKARIKKAKCILRAWMRKDGTIYEFDAKIEHREYAQRLALEEFQQSLDQYDANEFLWNLGWLHVGFWTDSGGVFMLGGNISSTQLHAAQTLLMKDPKWSGKLVCTDKGELPTEEFLILNKVSDIRSLVS